MSAMKCSKAIAACVATETSPRSPSDNVTFYVPRLKGVTFETAIIERYHCCESNVEEALIEMYLVDVSVHYVEDIAEALWEGNVCQDQ